MKENDENRDLFALIERARDLSIDLAAAQQRELDRRFSDAVTSNKFRGFFLTRIRRRPRMYRLLLILRDKIN